MWGSVLGRTFRALRLPLSPYPSPLNFMNRHELLVGGLRYADRVIMAGDAERSRLSALGLRDEAFEVRPPIGGDAKVVEGYLELYAGAIGSR